MSTLREDFKTWLSCGGTTNPDLTIDRNGNYRNLETTKAFGIWQTATKRAQQIVLDDSDARFHAKHFYAFRSYLIHRIKGDDK